jgi:hypothetical protein
VAAFTYRSARSPGLIIGISIVVLVESVAFHAMLMTDHPLGAWILTLTTLSLPAWLLADYRAMGVGTVNTSPTDIDIRIGRRASVAIPKSRVASAIRPTFRDLPQSGASRGSEYINLTKWVTPNVLLTLHEPATVSMGGLIKQPARRIALHLDDPDAFLADLRS